MMAEEPRWRTVPGDVKILRDLAKRQWELSQDPAMEERRCLWRKHNALQGERPMVLIESHDVRSTYLPDSSLRCEEKWARRLERNFRLTIFGAENVRDDSVVDPYLRCNWEVQTSDYGVTVERERGTDTRGGTVGYRWDYPIKDPDKDFGKLHPRTFSVDREATLAWKAHLEEIFEGILPVRLRGTYWWTMGTTLTAAYLIGLENLMLYMFDKPRALHRLMAFLRDDHLAFVDWLEREGLFTLNNDNDYIGSGTRGFATELPRPDRRESDPIRAKDLWVLMESQETVGISPEMFAEFIFPYQLPVAGRFGLCYYGCCEPVHSRWEILKQIPNLRSVSVSPWCDEEIMAEALGRSYVYSRKPSPALLSTDDFDEEAIRRDLQKTLRIARDCEVELIMKDVHNINNDPRRLGRWVAIAREVIDECA